MIVFTDRRIDIETRREILNSLKNPPPTVQITRKKI